MRLVSLLGQKLRKFEPFNQLEKLKKFLRKESISYLGLIFLSWQLCQNKR